MTSKCANPSCTSAFRYLRDGKLFQVPAGVYARYVVSRRPSLEKAPVCDEFFWLCGDCSKHFTIVVDPVMGACTIPRGVPDVMGEAG
jgi:hypothetical protein